MLVLKKLTIQKRRGAAEQLRQNIRMEWESLWNQCFEDKNSAEYVARRDYELLFIERGSVIKATRNYKAPDLREIMERTEKICDSSLIHPNPKSGGWRKFSKDVLNKQRRWTKNKITQG